jgi:hypothetical protein
VGEEGDKVEYRRIGVDGIGVEREERLLSEEFTNEWNGKG